MIELSDVINAARDKQTIGIDGWPVSGKSTLFEQLQRDIGAVCLYLDDFVLPESQWPVPHRPGYPFPYIRYDAFLDAARQLATQRHCVLQPYDWASGELGPSRILTAEDRPVVIEGVSALCEVLAPLYDLRIWVESDLQSTLLAAEARGTGTWSAKWRDYFLPSVGHYAITRPRERADLIVRGRGFSAPSAHAPQSASVRIAD